MQRVMVRNGVFEHRRISYTYPTVNNAAATLNYGTVVILTATATVGSTVSWSGHVIQRWIATAATCVIIDMNAVKNVTATFSLPNTA